MEAYKILIIGLVFLLLFAFVFYRMLLGYVERSYGDGWLASWGNKVYFWQSILFSSMGGTVLVMYALKWMQILEF